MMPAEVPTDFDPKTFYRGIYLFQKWEVFPGIFTEGPKDVVRTLEAMGFPESLEGKRVLDIAPWNGFFSFECARRGAREVVALGPEDPMDTGFEQTRALLDIQNVRYVRGSIYDLAKFDLGSFDVILFLGLIYHLRHPLLALDIIHDACTDQMYTDTPYIDNIMFDRTVSEETKAFFLDNRAEIHKIPLLYYTEAAETGDPYNWFMPNLLAFRALVRSSGFDIVKEANDGGGWCWISARKGVRPFAEGLEGYNAYAAKV
jgi:tRNA (mo5U34)-methyltransferase